MFGCTILEMDGRLFYKSAVLHKVAEEKGYAVEALFSLDDVKPFKDKRGICVEMWVDEQDDINVRLVSKEEYVDLVDDNNDAFVSVIGEFDTAKNLFEIPAWMVGLSGRMLPLRSGDLYPSTASFAVGIHDFGKGRITSQNGVVGEIRLLRRIG